MLMERIWVDQNSRYFKQVELLVQVLPAIVNYGCLALKGGTAINLFVRNLRDCRWILI
jgi:hypothetical protein